MKDEEIIKQAHKRFKLSADAWADNRRDYVDDVEFGAGNQWPAQVKNERDLQGRPCLVVPRLQTFIRQVTNDQRQNRPSIKVRPVDDYADPETAEIMQGLIRHIEANSNADLAYDNATQYAVTGGFGFWRVVTDYPANAFEQEIYIRPIANSLSVYPDARSVALDGSDWDYCFIIEEMPREEFESKYGKDAPKGWADGDNLEEEGWVDEDTVRLAEYYYRERVKDELLKLDDDSVMFLSEYEKRGIDAEIVDRREQYRYEVKWCLLAGSAILDRKDWAGTFIPVVPVYGDQIIINGKRVLMSLIRLAKDAQRMLNYYRSTEAEIYALQPKTPFIAAEGQIEGYEGLWAEANAVNLSYLPYKPVTIGGAPVPPPQRSMPMGLPQGALQMSEIAEKDMMNIIGIHEAGLGMRSNETSGAAIMARQREGDTATSHFIDNVTRAIRYTGQILVDLIPKIYDTPRVVRILGDDGSEESVEINQVTERKEEGKEIERIYDLGLGQYDVVCTAGPSYTTKRQESAQAMMQIIPQAPILMQAAPDLLIKAMDWPGSEAIAERLAKTLPPELRPKKDDEQDGPQIPQEVQQQMQQAQQQIQQMDQVIQKMQAELDSKQAQDAANMAKVETERAKLLIEQEKVAIDRYNAETNRIKAESEIALKANGDLTEAEKVQFQADLQLRLKEMDQDHQVELELLRKQMAPQPVAEPQGAVIERDANGQVLSVNGRAVVRDTDGNIVGLQ